MAHLQEGVRPAAPPVVVGSGVDPSPARRLFADLELVVLDAGDVPVAAGWAVPLRWDGDPTHLPGGYSDSLVRAVQGHDEGEKPDTLVVMAAQVHPSRRGQGLASRLLTAMRHLADQQG